MEKSRRNIFEEERQRQREAMRQADRLTPDEFRDLRQAQIDADVELKKHYSLQKQL